MSYCTHEDVKEAFPVLDGNEAITDDVLEALIAEFEQLAENYRGVAYEPRDAEVTVRGSGQDDLLLPNVLVSDVTAAIDGTDIAVDTFTVWGAEGTLYRAGGWDCGQPVALTYTHGHESPPPAILRACMEWVRAKALEQATNAPRNTIGYSDDAGWSYRESTADWNAGRPTGLLTVDAALNSMPDHRIMGV